MGLKKGQSNNLNGRKKGSLNKTTTEIKELMVKFVSKNIDNIQSDYDSLEAREKLMFIEKIIKLIIPSAEAKGNYDIRFTGNEPINITYK